MKAAVLSKAHLLLAITSSSLASACMSDKACEGGEVSMCCYMNECVPSSYVGCTNARMEFYKHLATLDEDCKMKAFAAELVENSPKVADCDLRGIHCIDYVTELMTDPGAFQRLDGVDALKEM